MLETGALETEWDQNTWNARQASPERVVPRTTDTAGSETVYVVWGPGILYDGKFHLQVRSPASGSDGHLQGRCVDLLLRCYQSNQLSWPEFLSSPEASLHYMVRPYLRKHYSNIVITIIIIIILIIIWTQGHRFRDENGRLSGLGV